MFSLRSLIVSKLLLRRLFSLLCSRRRSCSWLTSCWCFCSKNTNNHFLCMTVLWTYPASHRIQGSYVKFMTDKCGDRWRMSWTLVCTFSKADMWVSKVSCSPSILTKASSCCFSLLSLSCSSLSKWCCRWCSAWINTYLWVWFILLNHWFPPIGHHIVLDCLICKHLTTEHDELQICGIPKTNPAIISSQQDVQLYSKYCPNTENVTQTHFFLCLDIVHGSYFQLCVDGHHLLKHISEHWSWGNRLLTSSLKPSLGFWGSRAAIQTRW